MAHDHSADRGGRPPGGARRRVPRPHARSVAARGREAARPEGADGGSRADERHRRARDHDRDSSMTNTRPVKEEPSFGVSITPVNDVEQLNLARRADELGLELLAVQDHPYQPSQLEMWTFLSHLAAHTSRISLMPDVADVALRPPALLAKAAV